MTLGKGKESPPFRAGRRQNRPSRPNAAALRADWSAVGAALWSAFAQSVGPGGEVLQHLQEVTNVHGESP